MKDFDELLDGVLREDAAAEPREGLEGRVMARVRGEMLPRSFLLRCLNGWRRWILVPAAACLGIVVMVWYVGGRDVSQPERIASRVPAPTFSAPLIKKPEVEGDSRSGLGGSVRAFDPRRQAGRGPHSRDAHLSDYKSVAKMGHPALVPQEVKPLPKLDVFPRVVEASSEVNQSALMGSQQERNEPIRIAAIEIAPLTIKPIGGFSEGFTK